MTTVTSPLSPTQRKQLLKNPPAWVREHGVQVGKRAFEEILGQRDALKTVNTAIAKQSKALSRAIGEAKKRGESVDDLLAEKRAFSEQEKAGKTALRELENRLVDMLAPPPPESDGEFAPEAATAVNLEQVRVAALQPDEAQAWDDFVKAHPAGTAYHLCGTRAVIRQSFGHECHYLAAWEGEKLVGLLPLVRLNSPLFGNFMVSQPFFNYGGALVSHPGVREKLLASACETASELGCSHVEYRDLQAYPDLPGRDDKVAMWLPLPDKLEMLWTQIGSKVRAQIKRAARFGLQVEVGGSELLGDFYRVFAANMRDLGTPVYSKVFFRNLLEAQVADTRLVVVRKDGKPVSVAFLLGFGERMEVPWASTLRSANQYDANMFLYWELLSQACTSGYRVFDFGRSTRDAPTFRFKKQWGAAPRQLHWHYWLRDGGEPPKINPDNPKYALVISMWQKLPVWVTRLLGPAIVKYLP